MLVRLLVVVSLVVGLSASVNAVRAVGLSKAPFKFETILDPVAAGCINPQIDEDRSGVYQIDDGRFGILVVFLCDLQI